MNKQKFQQIKADFHAYKHWCDKIGETSQYEDSFGPDMDWLISYVEYLQKENEALELEISVDLGLGHGGFDS